MKDIEWCRRKIQLTSESLRRGRFLQNLRRNSAFHLMIVILAACESMSVWSNISFECDCEIWHESRSVLPWNFTVNQWNSHPKIWRGPQTQPGPSDRRCRLPSLEFSLNVFTSTICLKKNSYLLVAERAAAINMWQNMSCLCLSLSHSLFAAIFNWLAHTHTRHKRWAAGWR